MLTEAAAERGLACLRRFAGAPAGLRPRPGARGGDADPARGAQPQRLPASGPQAALGSPDRGHLRPRGSAPDLRRRGPPAALGDEPRLVIDIGGRSTEMILGHGRAAGRGRVVPGRLRQPVDALLRRRRDHGRGFSRRPGGRRRRARGGPAALCAAPLAAVRSAPRARSASVVADPGRPRVSPTAASPPRACAGASPAASSSATSTGCNCRA